MSGRLSASISHPLPVIDPYLDNTRDEGEGRHALLRTALRCFAKAAATPRLVDSESDGSFGAYLAARRGAAHGRAVLAAILNLDAETKAGVCLVKPTTRVLQPAEADELSPELRRLCVPVARSNAVALPLDADPAAAGDAAPPQICVHFDKETTGGTRRARMELERLGREGLAINMVSGSGARKYLKAESGVPAVVLDRLFAPSATPPMSAAETGPTRKNALPDYARLALVDFLERRVRLQVSCTVAAGVFERPPEEALPPRPVVLDGATLVEFDPKHKSWLAIKATLHGSASSCICRAHGLRFHNSVGRVEVLAETCGRPLEENGDGGWLCPCHTDAVSRATGTARFAVGGRCIEATGLTITCWHQEGATCRRGVRIDNVALSDADRLELATLLVNIEEFEGRTCDFFTRQWATNQPMIAEVTRMMAEKFKESMRDVEEEQVKTEDPAACNPKALLQRDMIAVDLLRGGGVFRHVVKRGPNRGRPYLARRKREGQEVPALEPHEADIISTHGHLFRCAKK